MARIIVMTNPNFDYNNCPPDRCQATNPSRCTELFTGILDSKATGEDYILARRLKMTSDLASWIICHMINHNNHNILIIAKTMLNGWKAAVITLLYKDGDRNQPSNHKPISNVLPVSKSMEGFFHLFRCMNIQDMNCCWRPNLGT